MPLKPGTLRCLSLGGRATFGRTFSSVWKSLLAGYCSKCQKVRFLKKSSGDSDSALCLSLTTLPFFFFFLRDFHLLPLKSQVHGSPSLRRNPVSWWGTHSVQAAGRGCRGGLRGGGDAAWGPAVESPAHLFGPPGARRESAFPRHALTNPSEI